MPTPAITLLQWYDRNRRNPPWRAVTGETPDPYRVWLAEVMLQQTTVAAVEPYFLAFIERWPSVAALAKADLDEVLHAWAGLGYYARARNLHACAKTVAAWRGGRFPENEADLVKLPGVGAYTAAAIAAIAFNKRAVVVDGNVERVMARYFAETAPLPGVKKVLKAHAESLTPTERCGDYAQAVMDLGATLCTPRRPACGICPWMKDCRGRAEGIAETLPRRAASKEKPVRYGIVFWAVRKDGAVWLRRRPMEGLLGGMMEFPSTPWESEPCGLERAEVPLPAEWRLIPGMVRHTFTHFHLDLRVATAQVGSRPLVKGIWVKPEALGDHALPSLMTKVARHALKKRLVG